MLRAVVTAALVLRADALAAAVQKVAVTGATGRLGRRAVEALVKQGTSVRCLVRHAPAAKADDEGSGPEVARWLQDLGPSVELLMGDVVDEGAVTELVKGCDAVLALHGATRRRKWKDLWEDSTTDPNHAKNVNCDAVDRLAREAARAGCTRIVRVTGKGETPWSFFSILINLLGCHAKTWNHEGERRLRANKDIAYTIVRPGVMGVETELAQNSLALADDGGDLKVSAIPHAQVADLCVAVLGYPGAGRATLTAMAVPAGEGADSYAALLPAVKPDRRAFPGEELRREHFRAVRVGGAGLAALFAGASWGVFSAARALVRVAAPLVRAAFGG